MAPFTAFPFPSHLKPTSTSTSTCKPKPNPKPASPTRHRKSPASASRDATAHNTNMDTTPSSPNSPSCVTVTTTIPKSRESTLTNLSKLYTSLPRMEQTNLLQLTHFIHLHATTLHLSAYDLLQPVEESILHRSGKAYHALLRILPRQKLDEVPTLDRLLTLVESLPNHELRENYHKPFPTGSARTGVNPHEIRACARPTRVQDSRNDCYVWIRGCYNVSPRIARNDVLLKDPLKHAEKLRIRGGRKDVFVSGWIASRVETAERVARKVRVEGEKEERERLERETRNEILKMEKLEREKRKIEEREQWEKEREEREISGVGVMTRKRRSVCYAESEEEDEGEKGDIEEFVCEELLDGSDHDESESGSEGEEEDEDESESERENTRVAGRVRVYVSERTRRAEKRARMVRKHSSDDEDESEDENGKSVRRSKRLRMKDS